MSAETKLSIIIPVYNVENYLRQCVDSLCMKWNSLFCEMILVDDGSADHSGRICDAYGKQYDGISVIHQSHAGAAAARNAGLRAACGEYILFIDADDYVADGALIRLLNRMQDQADFYFLKIQKKYPDGSLELLDSLDDLMLKNQTKECCIKYLAGLAKFPGSACAKAVKRALIQENQIFFEEGMTAEDLVWTLKCILHAESFRYLDFPFYYYRKMRAGSVTFTPDVHSLRDLRRAVYQGASCARCRQFCTYRNEIYAMMAYEAQVWLLLYGGLNRAGRIRYEAQARELCRLLQYRRDKRAFGIRWLAERFGVRRAAWMLRLIFYLTSGH